MKPINQYQHIAIRLPNWLGDICMALPIIRALQANVLRDNPSAQFTLLMLPQYVSLMQKLEITGKCEALPKKGAGYFMRCLTRRGQFDAHILFTNSQRGDLEAWLMGAKARFGVAMPNRQRRLLTDRYVLNANFDQETMHQTALWVDYAKHFGWLEAPMLAPYSNVQPVAENNIALICGSSNAPEKRWGIQNWQQLIQQLVTQFDQVTLLGTAEDRVICDQVQSVVADTNKVQSLAGKTSLSGLVDVMRQQRLVIGNDTGGLHLANVLGVPVMGIFGPTNPVRTKPIHHAPVVVVQSAQGAFKGKMSDVTIDAVLEKLSSLKL